VKGETRDLALGIPSAARARGRERGAELSVSARNARRLLARGGRETGRGLYRVMVAFHAVFLPVLALGAIAHRDPPPAWAWLAVAGVLAAQGLRWWAVRTLGGRWKHASHRGARGEAGHRGPYRCSATPTIWR